MAHILAFVVISPQPGSTNSSESHHIIKQEVERKETKLSILIKTIIDDQICQNEKAVINQGEWCFAQEYSTLVKPVEYPQPHGSCTQPNNSLQPVAFNNATSISSQPDSLQYPAELHNSTNDSLQPMLACSQQPGTAYILNGNGYQLTYLSQLYREIGKQQVK